MTRSRLLAVSLFAAALTPALSLAADPLQAIDSRFVNGIAAIVEDRIVTVDEVKREIRPLLEQIQRQARNQREFEQQMAVVQQEVIQSLVDRILLVKEFEKQELAIPASFIEARLDEELAEQFQGDRARFLAYLRERGISTSDYRKEIEDRVKVSYMRAQMFKSQSVVSPVRIEEYYRQNLEKFQQPDEAKLRLIRLTQIADEGPEVLRQTAEKILAELKAGADFGELAKKHSQDARAKSGGDWGWVGKDALSAQLSERAFGLKKGEFSEPIQIGNDLFILFIEDRKFAGAQAIDDVRPEIERYLSQQLARDGQERLLERLRGRYFVRYF